MGAAVAMPDQDFLRAHRIEYSFLLGRYMVEHLVRVHRMFEGDIATAVVLGTIAHYNYRRFHDEVVQRSVEPMHDLFLRGEHLPLLRPCNAMSVSESTGIPRETVRRKIKWLVARGWVRQEGRDRLFATPSVGADFAEFDGAMLEDFNRLLTQLQRARQRTAARVSAAGTDARRSGAKGSAARRAGTNGNGNGNGICTGTGTGTGTGAGASVTGTAGAVATSQAADTRDTIER